MEGIPTPILLFPVYFIIPGYFILKANVGKNQEQGIRK
jgi:hypothetical protein